MHILNKLIKCYYVYVIWVVICCAHVKSYAINYCNPSCKGTQIIWSIYLNLQMLLRKTRKQAFVADWLVYALLLKYMIEYIYEIYSLFMKNMQQRCGIYWILVISYEIKKKQLWNCYEMVWNFAYAFWAILQPWN